MDVNWVRIKDALYNLDEDSGASVEYAKGIILGVFSSFVALGWQAKSIMKKIIPCLPNGLRIRAIPPSWLNPDECFSAWEINLKNVIKFGDLLKEIPTEMLTAKNDQGDWEDLDWTCRDHLLDKYLYICSIFQRERDIAYRRWEETHGFEPAIVCSFSAFRKAGSQYIAEWAVSDMTKPREESYNWYGQNTSRWLYAGALCVQDGRVSIHT